MKLEGREATLFERMINYSLDMFCALNEEGRIMFVNDACSSILGYCSSDMVGVHFSAFICADEKEAITQVVDGSLRDAETTFFECHWLHASGRQVPMSWSLVWTGEDKVAFGTGRDKTEQAVAAQKLSAKEDLHQALIEHGSDMMALLDENGNYLYSTSSIERLLGYQSESLSGFCAFEFVHPDDLPHVLTIFGELLQEPGAIRTECFRFKNIQGEWCWLEAVANNQMHNPHIKALVISARDVTERIVSAQLLLESEQQFKALFDANPDAVLTENKQGIITNINGAGEALLRLPKNEIIGKPLAEFLPPANAAACFRSLQEAFEGNAMKFELELTYEEVGTLVLDISKIPVVVKGAVRAVHTIIKDMTALTRSHNLVKQQAKKLNNIFESMKDGFCTLDRDWKYTFANGEFNKMLRLNNKSDIIGKYIWDVFPNGPGSVFDKNYTYALATGNAVNFEAYSGALKLWLDVKAYPLEDGLLIYFSDVTERVKAKMELEMLSLVASKTTNGVIISNPDCTIEWVNDGFVAMTGFTLAEAVGKKMADLQNPMANQDYLVRVQAQMQKGEPVSFEVPNSRKDGADVWLSVQVNPIKDKGGNISRYIITQTDITALKKSELELSALTSDLYKHNRDLQQFTYIVSHNLRAPVANAMGLANMLLRFDKNSEQYQKALNSLNSSVARLDTVLKDLNMMLSIRDSQHTLSIEQVNLADLLQQVLENLKEPLEACEASVNLAVNVNLCVSGNSAYLYSVFYNLLSNAIKYRSIQRQLQIDIRLYGSTRLGAFVSVADNGIGFDREKAGENLFKLYKRFHTTAEGRGIGLFLTKTHLEAMGGSIRVNSQLNVGTRFLLQFA